MARTTELRDLRGELELKHMLVEALGKEAKRHDTQRACANSWGIPQPTVSNIVSGNMKRLTIRQLLGIAWKSGATISIGLNYAN